MQSLEFPGWRIEYDPELTAALHELGPNVEPEPEACGCNSCLNWAETRQRILPIEFTRLLTQLGIPLNGEAEVYHNARLENGLHSYGGWYHFVGKVLYGEAEDSPFIVMDTVQLFFHSQPCVVRDRFLGHQLAQMDIYADVPWLSTQEEAL